jgi:membrane protein required for beta-lactamase induction
VVEVPVLTADTREEGRAVCSLARAATSRGVSDAEFIQRLNEALSLLSTA